MEWLTVIFANAAVRDIAYATILTAVIVMIIVGWLIPKRTHEKMLAAANQRGDEWKEAAGTWETVAKEQSSQINQFAESSKTPAEFFGRIMEDGGVRRAPAEDAPHS
jgi:uncharacterized ion transporter superfamily protein YfcC